MELKGQIEEIIYQNELNSYTICNIKVDGELITAVGYLPFIVIGDTVKLNGKYVMHQEYGEQFKIDTFEKIMPETLEGLEKYLGSGIIKGIGPNTAQKIIEKFGEETINIFKCSPEKLSLVKGISKIRALEMAEEFNEKWELWQIVAFLEKFGVNANNAKKIYDALSKNAVEEIEKNPYILVDISYGVDFKKIDKIAMEIGIATNNEKRIESAIKYGIIISAYNGHTCVVKDNLIIFMEQLLNVPIQDIENGIINLKVKEEIIVEKREEEEWIYLYPFYKAEKNIAEIIQVFKKSKNVKKIERIQEELKKQEKQFGIELSEKQKEAIEAVNENNICVITGGPGTGKTTIIKNIIELYKKHKKKVVLCAPTGRAAKKMSETTGEEAKTIHRLLDIGKIEEDDKIESVDADIAPIDADVIIIDEMSMVDLFLMNYIMKSVYIGTKLVLVGDVNQLPSVGPGSVLKDIIESETIETVQLNHIFRQAAKSHIIVNAHNVNNGEPFAKKQGDEISDFFYINESNQEKILNNVISLCNGRLKNYGDYDFFKNIQVLTPTKKGKLGTKELNKELQKQLNPESELKGQKNYGEVVFREGDRIMQTKNNYDIYWEKDRENGTGVFNGEMGYISKIDDPNKQIKITFDDEKVAWYSYTELEQIEHAYGITIHKSQRK